MNEELELNAKAVVEVATFSAALKELEVLHKSVKETVTLSDSTVLKFMTHESRNETDFSIACGLICLPQDILNLTRGIEKMNSMIQDNLLKIQKLFD